MNHDHYDSPLHEPLANQLDHGRASHAGDTAYSSETDPAFAYHPSEQNVHLGQVHWSKMRPVQPEPTPRWWPWVRAFWPVAVCWLAIAVMVQSTRTLSKSKDALAEGLKVNHALAAENKRLGAENKRLSEQLARPDLSRDTSVLLGKVTQDMIDKGATEFHANGMGSNGMLLRFDAHLLPMDPKEKGKGAAGGKAKL